MVERGGGSFYAVGPRNARLEKDAREQADRYFCSQNKGGMEPDNLLCSRNARPQKALVGRAQWKITQPPSPKKERASLVGSSIASLDGRSRTDKGCPSERDNERAWMEHLFLIVQSTCTIGDQPGYPNSLAQIRPRIDSSTRPP